MTTRSSQQPWFLSTLLGVIVAKGLGRREEPGEAALRSHKGGSVAVSVVVLFQGGFAFFIFFFFCSEGVFHGTLHRINETHQQMGAVCTRAGRGRHLFSLHTRGFQSCTDTEWVILLPIKRGFCTTTIYSIDTIGALVKMR